MFQQSQCHKSDIYSYNPMQISNAYPQGNMFDICNSSSGQNYNRYQVNYTAPFNSGQEQQDSNWDNRLIFDTEKAMKVSDKIDLIEITSKDLSPVSYCSDLLPDVYKNNKEANHYNNQWYYNYNQKCYEYPSCAQVNKNNTQMQRNSKYCSIQKNNSYCEYAETDSYYKNSCQNKNGPPATEITDLGVYNYYHDSFPHIADFYTQNQGVIPFETIGQIDQNTEDTNEESDIIVEESDEDVTDCSEDHENQTYKCVVCNVAYTPLGTQFYFLTSESPLTMTTQKPVFYKIVSVVGKITTKRNYLCSECLGLINTIDHLTVKLENFQQEFVTKFKTTCKQNSVNCVDIKRNKLRNMAKYKCKICKKVLCLYKYCQFHLKSHKISENFLCELCGLTFKKYILLKSHKQKHKIRRKIKSKTIVLYKCSHCKRKFRTKSNLKEHVNYCSGILPYKCTYQVCDKKFPSSTKLKNHVKLKHEKKFVAICSICNIGFVKLSDYKSHKISHSTDKKFSCSKCDKSYKTLSNLNFHLKVHNEKMPFNCDLCSKGFLRKEYLEAHVNNHSGIKNYNCAVCKKKFVSQKNLDAHLKYHDGTVKKNSCNICGKTMATGFEEHLRIHNNLREFECNQCDLKFNTKGTLSKHVKVKHRNAELSNK